MKRRLRERADTVVMVVLSVLFLPGRIIEEGVHALASLPFADVVSVELEPRDGTARTVVRFREDAPSWAVTVAHLAPEALAAVSALAVIVYWLAGGGVWFPATTLDWALLSVLGAQFLAIALPSAADADQTPTETQEIQQ